VAEECLSLARNFYEAFSALSLSYRNIAPSKTCAPFPQSSGLPKMTEISDFLIKAGSNILGANWLMLLCPISVNDQKPGREMQKSLVTYNTPLGYGSLHLYTARRSYNMSQYCGLSSPGPLTWKLVRASKHRHCRVRHRKSFSGPVLPHSPPASPLHYPPHTLHSLRQMLWRASPYLAAS
jgi:hypothetical protein